MNLFPIINESEFSQEFWCAMFDYSYDDIKVYKLQCFDMLIGIGYI